MADEADSLDFVAEFMDNLMLSLEEEYAEARQELPHRRYLTHGQTAADCDQVTVSLIQLYRGDPGAPPSEPTNCGSVYSALVEVEILRKVPNIAGNTNMVDENKLDTSGRQHARDMTLLIKSLCRMKFPRYAFTSGMFADVTAGETQGDYAGPKMTVTAIVG